MYQFVNLGALSKILDINLVCPPDKFSMRVYENLCGTSHCLIGNYAVFYGMSLETRGERYRLTIDNIQRLLNITQHEYDFLFDIISGITMESKPAFKLSQKEALTRLAKFIIYKRRKKEIWADFEKARRTEGDNMFCDVTEDAKELIHV